MASISITNNQIDFLGAFGNIEAEPNVINLPTANKKTENKAKADAKKPEPKEEEYQGTRRVVVYGQELFTEENSKITLEEIRQRIVDEYHYPEFSKDRTFMSLDKESGIVVPVINFQKKG